MAVASRRIFCAADLAALRDEVPSLLLPLFGPAVFDPEWIEMPASQPRQSQHKLQQRHVCHQRLEKTRQSRRLVASATSHVGAAASLLSRRRFCSISPAAAWPFPRQARAAAPPLPPEALAATCRSLASRTRVRRGRACCMSFARRKKPSVAASQYKAADGRGCVRMARGGRKSRWLRGGSFFWRGEEVAR